MNRIEEKFQQLKKEQKKAFVTYITAGLPDMERCKELIKAQEEAGLDVLELGVPFSDPVADGPVIQDASFRSIQKGTSLRKCFDLVEKVRKEGVELPIVFMMYYNTITHYGLEEFARKCNETGVDGLLVPDLPMEEQGPLKEVLGDRDETILLQLVSPVSAGRIPEILQDARGFVYCVSSMGVTGQAADFHKSVLSYLKDVKQQSSIPVLMGFGIRTPQDVAPMKEIIDGAIVGSHFINLMEQNNYDLDTARNYIREFKAGF
ncbi:MAG TPA: tryptophan synthase subunit alpha [Lachnospiraceae bacterium]|jgi:tryptophan synthase alpha chain|uniref:tryptophan synthase subunit alpha n=1 Tax=Clostridium sp. (strain SY8519) TaxID=1042156 RepID=UPI0002171CA5|nr:tryptophan synthase subunit alpha [Clostridium sp. SY8519]BAK48173.1 chloride channel protein EriC [Clostridium sp. SY8519]HAD19443.1 tryptophan synthase subunit alpha [Lachnospiraceae bacterium]